MQEEANVPVVSEESAEARVPYLLAVFLEKLAELVATKLASAIAQEVAGQFIKFVFGHLATKADLEAAVQQIVALVELRMDQLAMQLLEGPLYAAEIHLGDHDRNPAGGKHLQAAKVAIVDAYAMMQSRIGQNAAFRRTAFVVICRLAAVELTIRVAETANNVAERPNLAAACLRWVGIIEECIASIEDHERRVVQDLGIATWSEDDLINPPPNGNPGEVRKVYSVYQGTAALTSLRRGTEYRRTRAGRGYSGIATEHEKNLRDASALSRNEYLERQNGVYNPARKLIDDLRKSASQQFAVLDNVNP